MLLPPNVSEATFKAALGEFALAVGAEWVFTSAEDLALYRDAYSPFRDQPEERLASAAVAPSTVEETQAIVRIANRHGIAIYPISTGRNLGYGGSAPALSGSVVVDLKRMNRIIEVNEANSYAIVEPGVSYFDLHNYIQEKGLKVWVDVPDPGWGSPIGNSLDRGGGYLMAHLRNHFDSHSGMEVVLPDGEILRTGMGAMEGNKSWAEFKSGFGPWVDGIFSQSNFGIVTKMGFWLMPQPEAYMKGGVLVPRHEDLGPLIEILNYVEDSRISTGMPFIGSPLLADFTSDQFDTIMYEGPPKLQPEHLKLLGAPLKRGFSPELQAYGLANDIAYWNVNLTYYGPPEVIAAQWAATKRLFSKIKDARFVDGKVYTLPLDAKAKEEVHYPELGMPGLKIFALGVRTPFNPTPANGHILFAPIIPRNAEAIFEANEVLGGAAREMKLPFYSVFRLPSCFWERSFVYVFSLPITEDPATNRHYVECIGKLIDLAAKHGWAEYRTPVLFQDQVLGTMNFNNGIVKRFYETLKDAIDPRGIIAPGRYGIWPKQMRHI